METDVDAVELIHFRTNALQISARVHAATQKNTRTALVERAKAVGALGAAEWEALRQSGHDLRLYTLTHLDTFLPQLQQKVEQAGGTVHWARDAAEARRIVLDLAAQHRVRRVVKVKSMLSEEIELNGALRQAGISAVETDLGEYIVQLAGSRPSHVTAPALHMSKEDIAVLFQDKLGVDAPPDPKALTEIARVRLRQEFLDADMGISGGNFLIAETGTLVLVTNEGNGRMATTLPPVHVAVVGIEKVIPDWASLSVLLKLLARSTTGQALTSYTSFLTGVSEGGPREFHLVLVDNGRTRILADRRARETLLCIRCGACANICPVYNHAGGHAYGWVYSGPIGAILTPQLIGTHAARDLPFASSLCGACADICPVKIPIPDILLHLRRRIVQGDSFEESTFPEETRLAVRVGARALRRPWLYRLGEEVLRPLQAPWRQGDWLPALPPPLDRWTTVRPLPSFRAEFRTWWRRRTPQGRRRDDVGRVAAGLALIGMFAALVLLGKRRRR